MRRVILILAVFTLTWGSADAQFRRRTSPSSSAPSSVEEQTTNYANPVEYTIGGIEVTGLNVLDKNAIVSLTGLRVGDKIRIPGDATANALRKLWKMGLVGDAALVIDRLEGDQVFLQLKLAERPRLSDFYFTGISKGKQSSLKEDINLIRGKIVNDAMIRNTELSVKKFFLKKGFLNTQVKIYQEIDTISRGNVRLRIDVNPMSKVKINRVWIEGNQEVSDSKLKSQLKKTKEHPRFTLHRALLNGALHFKPRYVREFFDSTRQTNWQEVKQFFGQYVKLNVFASSKFIRADFDEDKQKLISYYNSLGYRDADVLFDTLYNVDDSHIDVVMQVNEGRKYYFRNITWTGNYIHSTATLNKILDIQKGDVYNRDLLDKKTSFNPKGADISGLYMDDGYLFFRVTPFEIAVDGDSIDIEMRIFEGDQATIDKVIISGNDRTSDHVIRRELSTIPGQKFRRSDIIRTQQMLSSMGYFNPQKIGQEIRPNPANGTVDIEWKLEEQSNDQIQLSGGWGGAFGFVGTVGVTFNNFSMRKVPYLKQWRPLPVGDGQRLSVQAQANGRSFQSYSISFTEPWLGGRKPNSLTLSFNHSISRFANQNFEFTSDRQLKNYGVTVGLGRRLEWPDNYFSLNNSLSYLIYDYANYFNTPSLPRVGVTNSLMFNTTLARNSIDNPMYPSSGSQISLSLSLTPPWSLWQSDEELQDINTRYKWIEMHKWMFDARFYIKLAGSSKPEGRSLVLETRAHMGFVGQYNPAVGYGPFERFVMGGAGLAGGFNSFVLGQEIIGLRGYEDNQVTPPLYANRGQPSTEIEGGIVYNKYSMELRYPVTTSQAATIYTFLFTEGGNNWNNYQEFNPFKLYRSAGAGVRIFMPAFGLIGLNWAYGFDTLPNSFQKSGTQFHFTIGQQIR